MVFLVILLGSVFSGVIGDALFASRTLGTTTNESATLINVTAVSLTNDDWTDASVIVYNASTEELVLSTNYSIDRENGRITLLTGSGFANMNTLVSYEFYPDDYVKGSNSSRVILGLTLLFFVIGVLILVIGEVKDTFKF